MSFLMNLVTLALLNGGDEPAKPKSAESQIWLNDLCKSISYPAFIETKREKEIVLLSFKLEPCGALTVLEMNYSNEEFKDYVLNELDRRDLNPEMAGDEIYHLRLSFVKE